mmetsp:Transcript_25487/g.69000  ORF Transcript_25487/g.69000 Transcript_25487/m.69000 type:complete len:132 (+) Transcript_25487:1298-1693(+)
MERQGRLLTPQRHPGLTVVPIHKAFITVSEINHILHALLTGWKAALGCATQCCADLLHDVIVTRTPSRFEGASPMLLPGSSAGVVVCEDGKLHVSMCLPGRNVGVEGTALRESLGRAHRVKERSLGFTSAS